MKRLEKHPKRISPKSRKPVSCLEAVKNPLLEAQEICVSKCKKKTKPYKKPSLRGSIRTLRRMSQGKDGINEMESLPRWREEESL